jgi:hypothetical protein
MVANDRLWGEGMADHHAKPAAARRSPIDLAWPIALGLLLGTATFGGYIYWSHAQAKHTLAAAPPDPQLAKPSADECAIARTALTAVHAARDEARWRAVSGVATIALRTRSEMVNPIDYPGFSDDEADDLRAKSAADWRWCPGMETFVLGFGWSPMNPDEDTAELGMGRPAMNKTGDEAKVYEGFFAPNADGAVTLRQGPWLVTLSKAGGAWRVTSKTDLKPAHV